jgi:hypothetical protein
MPWAVTANVAFVNTAAQFDLRFPKTGGGEDIDYCLQVACGRLVPVPQVRVGGNFSRVTGGCAHLSQVSQRIVCALL